MILDSLHPFSTSVLAYRLLPGFRFIKHPVGSALYPYRQSLFGLARIFENPVYQISRLLHPAEADEVVQGRADQTDNGATENSGPLFAAQ